MIVLITPTGARPRQIKLCAEYMHRQTYKGQVIWIVVDDAVPSTTSFIRDDFRTGWQIININPHPSWQHGQNTQGRNIRAGIEAIRRVCNIQEVEAVFIIEDDDYYKPQYIEVMVDKLRGYDIAGEMLTVYYNVTLHCWLRNANRRWSSLFQTAFHPRIIPVLEQLYAEKFIDCVLFQALTNKNLFEAGDLAIGIKGQRGRDGIGAGHRPLPHYEPDPSGMMLFAFIGNDAKNYEYDWNSRNL